MHTNQQYRINTYIGLVNSNGLIVIGCLNYPRGSAPSNRVHLYCKAFKAENGFPLVINLKSTYTQQQPTFNYLSRYDGVPFYYSQQTSIREKKFVKRNINKIKGFLNAFIVVRRIKKTRNITVLFFSIPLLYEFIFYLFLKFNNVPIIREWNEAPEFLRNKKKHPEMRFLFMKHIRLKMYDGIIVISDYLNNYFSNIYPRNRIFQIPILVDMLRFDGFLVNVDKKDKIVAYIGGMGGDKDGLANLIEAFAIVRKNIKSIQLQLIGSAPEADITRLKRKIEDLDLNDAVKFLGSKSSKEIPQFMANADLLVLARPNNIQAEAGFPTKLGEYLASGKPVVITKTGEITKYLTDLESAYLAEPGDVTGFAEKIIFAIKDVNSNKIGIAGFQVANENFNYKLFQNEIYEIISKKIRLNDN